MKTPNRSVQDSGEEWEALAALHATRVTVVSGTVTHDAVCCCQETLYRQRLRTLMAIAHKLRDERDRARDTAARLWEGVSAPPSVPPGLDVAIRRALETHDEELSAQVRQFVPDWRPCRDRAEDARIAAGTVVEWLAAHQSPKEAE